jgi:hypothetical protein
MIIEGIPSGDLECWCLLVTKETFIELMGKPPDDEFDIGRFAKKGNKYRYKIYPSALIDQELHGKKDVLVISVDVIKKKDLE